MMDVVLDPIGVISMVVIPEHPIAMKFQNCVPFEKGLPDGSTVYRLKSHARQAKHHAGILS